MKTIIDKQTATHYTWGEKCESWIFVDSPGLSVKRECMPTGSKEQMHFHSEAQQFFFVLKGKAVFYVENEKIVLYEQQGLNIKAGTKHFISNQSSETLDFLVISQPSTNADRTNV